MKKTDYICINGCTKEYQKNHVDVDYLAISKELQFNCCSSCGALLPATIKYIKSYFRIIQIQNSLDNSINLLYSSHFNSAIRDAVIVLETRIQNLSNLYDLNGQNLVSKAFNFSFSDNKITKFPLIQLNSLENVSKRNEQEGFMLSLLGFFKGIRNIYMHNQLETKIYLILNVFTQISYFLHILDGDSFANSCKKNIF